MRGKRLTYEEIAEIDKMIERHLSIQGVIKRSRHLLKSGDGGGYFFDFDLLIHDPYAAEEITRRFADKILEIAEKRSIDFLAFIEKANGATIGALRLSGAISIYTRIPNIPIRLKKEVDFEKVKIPGVAGIPLVRRLRGKKFVIVTDHSTTGEEALSAVNAIEKNGGQVTDIVSFSSTPSRIHWNKLSKRGIHFHSLRELPDPSDVSGEAVMPAVSATQSPSPA